MSLCLIEDREGGCDVLVELRHVPTSDVPPLPEEALQWFPKATSKAVDAKDLEAAKMWLYMLCVRGDYGDFVRERISPGLYRFVELLARSVEFDDIFP